MEASLQFDSCRYHEFLTDGISHLVKRNTEETVGRMAENVSSLGVTSK